MSKQVRAAVVAALGKNPIAGSAPLFPAPESNGAMPWDRYHARALLGRAEGLAELPPLDSGDFHPCRRAWVTARKHLPDVDVAACGGWKTPRTLTLCYQQPDARTMFAVVSEGRKLRSS